MVDFSTWKEMTEGVYDRDLKSHDYLEGGDRD